MRMESGREPQVLFLVESRHNTHGARRTHPDACESAAMVAKALNIVSIRKTIKCISA